MRNKIKSIREKVPQVTTLPDGGFHIKLLKILTWMKNK